jgi:hypothetical protein
MAAIDFPNSPTVGQLFTVGDITWEWTGTVWQGQGTAIPGVVAATAPITYDDETQTVGITQSGITIEQSQVTGLSTSLAGKVDEVNGAVTTASTSATVVRNITLSTSEPTGGMDGDVWLVYEA